MEQKYCFGCMQHVDDPEQICPYCGERYTGALGAVITALHGVIWLICKMFGYGNPFGG